MVLVIASNSKHGTEALAVSGLLNSLLCGKKLKLAVPLLILLRTLRHYHQQTYREPYQDTPVHEFPVLRSISILSASSLQDAFYYKMLYYLLYVPSLNIELIFKTICFTICSLF